MSACLGQFAVFSCSSTVPNSRLFWFVNGAPVTALPEAYDALSSSVRDSSSDFRILALEENNNSMIVCAADTSNRISNFTKPVFLTVIRSRLPSPPTDLQVDVNEETATANITWNLLTTEIDLLYTVNVINFTDTFKYESTTTIISMINTTQEYLEYNLSLFDSCKLSSVRFSVSVILVNSTPCPESRQSEMMGFSDVMSVMEICEDYSEFITLARHTAMPSCDYSPNHDVKLWFGLLVAFMF